MTEVAITAIGCSVGRNIFQHKRPEAITHALSRIFRNGWPATQALEELADTLNGNEER